MTIRDHTEAWQRVQRARLSPDLRPVPSLFSRLRAAWRRWRRHREVRALNRRADRLLRGARHP